VKLVKCEFFDLEPTSGIKSTITIHIINMSEIVVLN
jgi:hypothetical protein